MKQNKNQKKYEKCKALIAKGMGVSAAAEKVNMAISNYYVWRKKDLDGGTSSVVIHAGDKPARKYTKRKVIETPVTNNKVAMFVGAPSDLAQVLKSFGGM